MNKRHLGCIMDLKEMKESEPVIKRLKCDNKSENIGIFKNERLINYLRKYLNEIILTSDKMKKFDIGYDCRKKKISITSQSSFASLCSPIIYKGLNYTGLINGINITGLQFCTKNYKCKCKINTEYEYKYSFNLKKYCKIITNSNTPTAHLEILLDGSYFGSIFLKKIAASNLKRICQPGTFSRFRISLSNNIIIGGQSNKFKFNINISKKDNNGGCFGVGAGYYCNNKNNINICAAFVSIDDTKFVITTNQKKRHFVIKIKDKLPFSRIIFDSNESKPIKTNTNNIKFVPQNINNTYIYNNNNIGHETQNNNNNIGYMMNNNNNRNNIVTCIVNNISRQNGSNIFNNNNLMYGTQNINNAYTYNDNNIRHETQNNNNNNNNTILTCMLRNISRQNTQNACNHTSIIYSTQNQQNYCTFNPNYLYNNSNIYSRQNSFIIGYNGITPIQTTLTPVIFPKKLFFFKNNN